MSKQKADSVIALSAAAQLAQLICNNMITNVTAGTVGSVTLTPDVMSNVICTNINSRLTTMTKGIK